MTVLEVIQRSAEFLAKKGVESPRLQVELLLAHVLQLPRLQLYLNFERQLSEKELDSLRELVQRRGRREPLQHLAGSVNFCGLEIEVTRDALIPRPETECLAERAWNHLGKRPVPTEGGGSSTHPRVLDVGTGTGCLVLAVAAHAPQAEYVAIDLSASALALARRNAERLGLSSRGRFIQSDGFLGLSKEPRFDLILSNPPYVPTDEIETLEPEVRLHDPRMALDGGQDGLLFYRLLATEAPAFLQPDGLLMAEFGAGQAAAIQDILAREGWRTLEIGRDLSHIERFVVACPG